MITLDCSEHIRGEFATVSGADVDASYAMLPSDLVVELEARYLGKSFSIDSDVSICFTDFDDFKRIVLIYLTAVEHVLEIFGDLIDGTDIDFEVSIDETEFTTTPQAHYFVANELRLRSVEVNSIAPRFVGEFQKGIDYRGDVSIFESDFLAHARIADLFGYKISVHSGSDKFSVFPAVSRLTDGRFHVKTAGTNWLEVLRVIAVCAPALYREVHSFALANLSEAQRYYHISGEVDRIADLGEIPDERLPDYLELDDSRQVLHITYGLVLQACATDGSLLFRDRIYNVLREHEDLYNAALGAHIGRHLSALGIA